jgi:hypothetical protein
MQCLVNNCPLRVRGNISPYIIYFDRPNTATYSALLGKSYKVGQTEYGLEAYPGADKDMILVRCFLRMKLKELLRMMMRFGIWWKKILM